MISYGEEHERVDNDCRCDELRRLEDQRELVLDVFFSELEFVWIADVPLLLLLA